MLKYVIVCLLVLVTFYSSGCSGSESKNEQMVNLNATLDNPESQLASLNVAIQNSDQQADLYARRAVILLRQQKLEKALADASEAVLLSKNAPYNLFVKAQVLRAMNKEDEALQLALRAERNGFENVLLYVLLSDLYYKLGQYSNARQYNNLAFKLSPSDRYVLYYKGKLAAVKGDTTTALKSYIKALEQEPVFFELMRELAGIYVARKELETARPYLANAIKLNKTDGLNWFYQGKFYQISEKTDSAIWSYNKAIRLADTLMAAHKQVGYLHFARGNYERAIVHLEKASQMYGNSARLLTVLASSYERTTQDQLAIENYEKLIKLDPGNTYGYQRIARLKGKLLKPVAVDTASTGLQNVTEEN
jgi:tetratricopeptide (TPR) repeat protein